MSRVLRWSHGSQPPDGAGETPKVGSATGCTCAARGIFTNNDTNKNNLRETSGTTGSTTFWRMTRVQGCVFLAFAFSLTSTALLSTH